MSEKIIPKKKISEFIGKLLKDYIVYAPVASEGYSNFAKISTSEVIGLGAANTKLSCKGLFFPQREVIFEFESDPNGSLTKPTPEGNRIVFGLRPCDARALTIIDKLFDNSDYQDPYYIEKRKASTIIGLACNEPQVACFCTSINGGGPFDTQGQDVTLVEVGEDFLVIGLSEKGEDLIKDLAEAKDDQVEKMTEVKERATEAVKKDLDPGRTKEVLDKNFDDPVWDEISLKCLGCGTCTYLCPTCHCFDIVDEQMKGKGVRLKNWDSCMFPLFTLHTSGHNPRESGKERMRNRIMHKFRYFMDNFGEIACVGCGRCIQNCPVNFDIREAINKIGRRSTG